MARQSYPINLLDSEEREPLIDQQAVGYSLKRCVERSLHPLEVRLRDRNAARPSSGAGSWPLTCEPPETHDCPISHRTSRELVREAIQQRIVADLTERYPRRTQLRPHRGRYWLNAKADERNEERISRVCPAFHGTRLTFDSCRVAA